MKSVYLAITFGLLPSLALAQSERLACDPEVNLVWDGNPVPNDFDPKAVDLFRPLVQLWDKNYQQYVEGANNGLISDLSKDSASCLSKAPAVSLKTSKALKAALKDCVFTNINAYSGPAISTANQDALAEAFTKAYWNQFRFRRVKASLRFDPIEAFQTKCVLELVKDDLPGYRLYLAGYTFD